MKKNDVGSIDKFPEKLQEYFGGDLDHNRLLADIFFKCFVETLCDARYVYNGEIGYIRLTARFDDHGRDKFRFIIQPSEKLYNTLENTKLDFISSARALKKIEWMHKNNISVRAENERMQKLVDKYLGERNDLTVKEMIQLLKEEHHEKNLSK